MAAGLSSSYPGHQKPDGGYGWVVVISGTMLCMLMASYFSVFGVVYIELVEYYNTSKSVISWAGAIQQCCIGLSGLLFGTLIAKYGSRRGGIATPVVVSIGYIATALSPYLWTVFVAYAFMSGIAISCYVLAGLSSVYPWFSKRLSLSISICLVGVPLGAFVWPPFVTWLVQVYAWKGAFIIVAGIHLNGVVLFALFRPPDQPNWWKTQKTLRMQEEVNSENHVAHEKKMENGSLQEEEESPQESNGTFAWMSLFGDPSFVFFFCGIFFVYTGNTVTYTYTTVRGVILGYSDTESALLSSVVGATNIVGRVLAGVLGNRMDVWGRVNAIVGGMLVCGAVSICTMFSTDYWFLATAAAIWGLASGFYVVYCLSVMIQLFGSAYATQMTGFHMACEGACFLLTNSVTGVLLDQTGNPSQPFAVFGSLQCLAAVMITLSAYIKWRRQPRDQSLSDLSLPSDVVQSDEYYVSNGK